MKHRRKHYDHHHVVPQSRDRRLRKDPNNIVRVDARRHNLYHTLFGNLLPDEIIRLLTKEFWNGQKYWVYKTCYYWDYEEKDKKPTKRAK